MVLLVTLLPALLCDMIFPDVLRRGSVSHGNGIMIALLLAATMPPATPLHVVAASTFFALAVVKWTFGGTGAYWVNPVAAGYAFAVVSYPGFGNDWLLPRTLGGSGTGTIAPLQLLEGATVEMPSRLVQAYHRISGVSATGTDGRVAAFVNDLELLSLRVPPGYVDLFLGNVAGTLGGTSVALLLLTSILLLGRGVISAMTPIFFLFTFSLVVFLFGALPFGGSLFGGDVLFHLTTGATLLGAFFIATETVSSPLTDGGVVVYAVLGGLLAGLLRLFGAGVHAVMLAILVINMVVPLIDRFSLPRRYGSGWWR